jgi:DNA-directed RNA polymerase subunit M/transcription elongation factor TFIIS
MSCNSEVPKQNNTKKEEIEKCDNLGVCPECRTDSFNLYMALLSRHDLEPDNYTEDTEELTFESKNVEVLATRQTNVNGRHYFRLQVFYTCPTCGHKWEEEDLT